ncbi:HAMP domain-containing histidine kinase [Marinomonas sp. M1K-6]|uniref:HAMP domain-containing histidine kinase n=1 Tax=Marinomonas profundi TaxID=2726122 RepID=A0A847R4B9_9GAMM|nr:HAMP domain-containing histidine kinase [Marinomonas profundi]NLQ18831.1 HAMP domain-containing histidine kinase [Marinomonas profundi]UDV02963.1 HAMP domain-containing histidine kinase [Marinomonas profundi]
MNKINISTILASAIHESKNQVGTLLYQLQGLKDAIGSQDHANQKKIVLIEESLKKLNDEWVEYLYLYKLASDGYDLHVDTFLLDEFLDDQVFALLPSANAKSLELTYACEPNLMGTFDERLMTAVVSTAVYNALRFAKSKIIISAKKINTQQGIPLLVIAIEDDGDGFKLTDDQPEEFLEGNTGLGLYFAELSAIAHNANNTQGFIEKGTSVLLGGACLSIYLPQSTHENS